jgi:hypothetical protein
MKTAEAMKIVDAGWVRKRKGFRVCFQKMEDSKLVTDYVPATEDAPFPSDVVAWRLAWKLSEATKSENREIQDGDIVNIHVVDDQGNRIVFYGTNDFEIYKPYETDN